MIVKYFDQSGLLEVRFSEELISLLERNDSRYNLTSMSTDQFISVTYKSLLIEDNEEYR